MLWSGTQKDLLKFSFIELRSYTARKAKSRGQFQKASEKLSMQRARHGLKLWQLNIRENRLLETKKQRACNLLDRLLMIRALTGLKEECLQNYKLKRLLKKIYDNATGELKRYAFKQVVGEVAQRGGKALTEKQLGQRKLLQLVAMGDKRKLKIWFDQLLANGRKKYIKELKAKACFKKVLTKNARMAFERWKAANEHMALVEEVNAAGPVRMQERALRQEVENLKQMLTDKRMCTDDEIKQMLGRDKRVYKKAVE